VIGELVGRAQRDEASRVEDGDLVDADDGCCAVRDDQDRLALDEAGERRAAGWLARARPRRDCLSPLRWV